MKVFTLLVSLLSASVASVAAEKKNFDPPDRVTAEVRMLLANAILETNKPNLSAQESISSLRKASEQAVSRLQPHSPAAETLAEASQMDNRSPDDQLARMKQAIIAMLEDLTFEPIAEAELPKGFPTYTPVGAIELKQYPAYRMAAGPGFWTLFMHIKLNGIAMTAPVQMTYSRDAGENWKESGMAFLYGDREIGSAGQQGKVTVLDQKLQSVVTLGVKGKRTPSVIADAQGRLQRWLDDAGKYQAAGDVRVMGYNSPYVPQDKQYFEVQIPLEAAAQSAAGNDDK